MITSEQLVPSDGQSLVEVCRRNGLEITLGQRGMLEKYAALLRGRNEQINLISRREENVWASHILHALSLLFTVSLPPGARVIDLGTGGGLPGIPLGIVRGDLKLLLIDSIAKKAAAVAEMASLIGLKNVLVRCGRAEELARAHEHAAEVVLARAVAPLAQLIKWSRGFLREASSSGRGPGMLIAYKGGDLESEIAQARIKCGTTEISVLPLNFPGSFEAGLLGKKLVIVNFTSRA